MQRRKSEGFYLQSGPIGGPLKQETIIDQNIFIN